MPMLSGGGSGVAKYDLVPVEVSDSPNATMLVGMYKGEYGGTIDVTALDAFAKSTDIVNNPVFTDIFVADGQGYWDGVEKLFCYLHFYELEGCGFRVQALVDGVVVGDILLLETATPTSVDGYIYGNVPTQPADFVFQRNLTFRVATVGNLTAASTKIIFTGSLIYGDIEVSN